MRKTDGKIKLIVITLLAAVLSIGMSVAVYADNPVHVNSVDVTGMGNRYTSVPAGETIDVVEYSATSCTIHRLDGYEVDENTTVTINGKKTKFDSRRPDPGFPDLIHYTFKVDDSSDSSDKSSENSSSGSSKKKSENHEPGSWVKNPNEKQSLGMSAAGLAAGTTLGWQEQGQLGKMAFAAAKPAGWSEGFSFNILTNGNADYSLKNGSLQLFIPADYLKAGRQYAVMGIGKGGIVKIFTDQDTNPNTITINLNLEGYAMELIYKD